MESETLYQYLSNEGLDHVLKVKHLTEEEATKDPITEPYKSRYAARALLLVVKSNLIRFNNISDSSDSRYYYACAGVELLLGENFIATEETSSGEEHLSKCIALLEGKVLSPGGCFLAIKALNQLGLLWADRDENEKSIQFLSEAEDIFKKYVNEVGKPVQDVEDIFKGCESENVVERFQQLEKAYTLTLYYLAQMYTKTSELQKSAYYCQNTLKRQLELKDYDVLEWAINCATLSQFYLQRNTLSQARHCLASSSFILSQAAKVEKPLGSKDEDAELRWENYAKKIADVARCWSKYGVFLLQTSRDKLIDEVVDPPTNQMNDVSLEDTPDKSKKEFVFDTLELTIYEEQVTDQLVVTFDAAREVFLWTQTRLNEAKEYYTFEDHASDSIEIIQDHSLLYKLLAFFEANYDRKCKMHKRRIDMLSAVLSELNPDYYLAVCRQLLYEIAESYSELIDNKFAIIEEQQVQPNFHAVSKINSLVKECIKHFQKFVDTFKKPNDEFPQQVDDNHVRPFLLAHFYMGRLHSKFIETDSRKRAAFIQQSIDCYQFLVDYCERNPEASAKVESELDLCKEMVHLLPVKVQRILSTR